MGIPIILGASERIRRTGKSFYARCPRCAAPCVKMFEAVKHTNVNAFLAISLWDGEDPVVQCGECLGLFGEEDAAVLRQNALEPPRAVGGFLSSLVARRTPAPAPVPRQVPPRTSSPPPPPKRAPIDESAIDAELLAMKKRLGK